MSAPPKLARRLMRGLAGEQRPAKDLCSICGAEIVWSTAWDPPMPLDPRLLTVVPDPMRREMIAGQRIHGTLCSGDRAAIMAMRVERRRA